MHITGVAITKWNSCIMAATHYVLRKAFVFKLENILQLLLIIVFLDRVWLFSNKHFNLFYFYTDFKT